MTLLPTLGKRDLTIDAARGTALVSMFIAHAAPSGGPGDVLNLSEFLTAALFATLVGAGAQQSAWHRTPWAVTIVRGGSLIGVGLLLHELGAQVYMRVGVGHCRWHGSRFQWLFGAALVART